mmetsp:Transcript_15627/g.17371  ORF Transcript_15627/g.17371 Transcript_15627/m.17371 type:complete len:263 (+) Transcript_15627:321-1109(+)
MDHRRRSNTFGDISIDPEEHQAFQRNPFVSPKRVKRQQRIINLVDEDEPLNPSSSLEQVLAVLRQQNYPRDVVEFVRANHIDGDVLFNFTSDDKSVVEPLSVGHASKLWRFFTSINTALESAPQIRHKAVLTPRDVNQAIANNMSLPRSYVGAKLWPDDHELVEKAEKRRKRRKRSLERREKKRAKTATKEKDPPLERIQTTLRVRDTRVHTLGKSETALHLQAIQAGASQTGPIQRARKEKKKDPDYEYAVVEEEEISFDE